VNRITFCLWSYFLLANQKFFNIKNVEKYKSFKLIQSYKYAQLHGCVIYFPISTEQNTMANTIFINKETSVSITN